MTIETKSRAAAAGTYGSRGAGRRRRLDAGLDLGDHPRGYSSSAASSPGAGGRPGIRAPVT